MENSEGLIEAVSCTSKKGENKSCKECFTSIDDCINSRRCFMTGEICSKQTNIQKDRKKLHEGNCINAFVIINFSNMSDVVYKWRLKSFIESLSRYFYIDKTEKKLHCLPTFKLDDNGIQKEIEENWEQVKAINVIRADSDPVSNYVICNRVCQQMQIADLVIVDVSVENTNVFYEFGMAVALGKMILPICYSESFYEMYIPKEIDSKTLQNKMHLEHHIDCYPWRKRLFEYYGIRYKSKKIYNDNNEVGGTRYIDFEDAVNKDYGFTDIQYDRFPYHEIVGNDNQRIGKRIYNKLKDVYNRAEYDDNTLVIYTMDGFLNEAQAGQCIINFYKNITKQMREEQCFCGERVGVLVQANSIPEDVKDAKTKKNLLYSVGEIIHIGMNQATYVASREKIKTQDFLKVPDTLRENGTDEKESDWEKDIRKFVKEYIRNKGILIYPNNPVYVNRIKNGLQKDILEKKSTGSEDFSYDKFFCLYHVMLRTLRYTNEIVVDISKNSLQALFWLGAAHGSDIYAITVQHEETNQEREILTGSSEKKERNIFDVAGLWTAILRSNDTEGFYRQLALTQIGIERHTKLMLKKLDDYEEKLQEYLYEVDKDSSGDGINEIIRKKKEEEENVLESYYRDCFWKPMLRYNRLWLYLPQVDDTDSKDGEPRVHIVKWDVDAVALLSYYLSKRKIIGEYRFKPLAVGQFDEKSCEVNFICIGDAARPLKKTSVELQRNSEKADKTESLVEYIHDQIEAAGNEENCGHNVIHKLWKDTYADSTLCPIRKRIYKGFVCCGDKSESGIITQLPQSECIDCSCREEHTAKVTEEKTEKSQWMFYHDVAEVQNASCDLKESHIQTAQLILWREVPKETDGRVYFRVALTGVSGPATYGLASIFVDDKQKEELFKMDNASGRWDINLLSKLQEKIRRKFVDIYCKRLQVRLDNEIVNFTDTEQETQGEAGDDLNEQKECYIKRVKHTAVVYLSTVLYRYFLPFLSREDENCICNGMRTYVASIMAAGVSPFSLNYPPNGDIRFSTSASEKCVKKAAEIVSEELEEVLQKFRGVEAFYQVEVENYEEILDGRPKEDKLQSETAREIQGNKQKRDTRIPIGIRELQDASFPDINCIFLF